LENFFVYIVDDENGNYPTEDFNSFTISRKQYTEFLYMLSEYKIIDEILKKQIFSCGSCRSYSLSAKALYSTLKKIERHNNVAEILSSSLRQSTSIEPFYFELLGQPSEIVEKALEDGDNFYEIKDSLTTGEFIIEEGVVYQLPEECFFVFDARCSCNRILRS
jgi:hypothetical protein